MDAESEEPVVSETNTTEEVANTTDESTEETPEVAHTEFEKKQFERAKLAEAENKKLKEQLKAKTNAPEVAKTQGDLSTKDLYVLIDNKVPQEDVDDVAKYAKFANLTIAEALKTNVVKTLLADKAEQRNVANATNTGTTKRGSAKVSDDTLMDNAEKGKFPEDPSALAAARFNKLTKK